MAVLKRVPPATSRHDTNFRDQSQLCIGPAEDEGCLQPKAKSAALLPMAVYDLTL